MILLPNVRFNTQRGSYNSSTQQTTGASPYLVGVSGHIAPTSSMQLSVLPEAAFGTEYYVDVNTGTKIAEGDYLTNITLPDGVTPWPGDVSQSNAPKIIWKVKLIQEMSPGLLPYRKVYLIRDRLSGPAGN